MAEPVGIAGVLLTLLAIKHVDCQCQVPSHFHGNYFSLQHSASNVGGGAGGQEVNTLINERGFSNELHEEARCIDIRVDNSTLDALGTFNAHILYFNEISGCYQCYYYFYRTPNVLQYQQTSCNSAPANGKDPNLENFCVEIREDAEKYTMFKKGLDTVNCKTTFEGTYHMTYEVDFGGGGICDSPLSAVVACQEPGSVYVDNQVFSMYFGKCPEVSSSVNENIKFQCMGSWRDDSGNIYAAIADLGKEIYRERFRCLLTRDDQQYSDNTRRYSMSRWASCSTLKSPYEGDIRLVLKPAIVGSHLVKPGCNFPRNFTGTWFSTGEFDTDVTINQTHIYFKTKLDEFTYKEALFTCQQTRDTRYMVTAVTVGKCEVDYVCFDFMPRHHNIIRWRMSRPYRLTDTEMALPNFMEKKFRQTCSWNSFTINRDEAARWKFNTFLLNPPAPVECPVGGRYSFEQIGSTEEQYTTRIRGITVRPRHTIDCMQYVTEMKSCDDNPKKIFIDAEYCATVDHTGRPIGEYDEADRELNCVGYWMEDMRSYMITYDEEDAVTPFRCWVYERLDWRDVIMSRATRAKCGITQTARSFTPDEGASLALVLKESERLFDSCPQRFDTGANPYDKELKIYVLEGASAIQCSVLMVLLLPVLTILIH